MPVRMVKRPIKTIAVLTLLGVGLARATSTLSGPYAAWGNGPPTDPNFFPVAVWLQSPANAARYRALGFNTYVGLWEGPTEGQLAGLRACGMRVICQLNDVGLRHLDDPTIIGWMLGDEPDNAQPDGKGGYGPPIPPDQVIRQYQHIKAQDPSRPVLLNLGQAVAWDGWYGRGIRTNCPQDYLQYVQAGDIVSFDIYPCNSDHPDVKERLWLVAFGVQRLMQWTKGQKIIWNCIECTQIGTSGHKPTPQQVKAQVWMSLIHGSRGLIYFVHVFKPRFIEAGLLADPSMAQAVSQINAQLDRFARLLNLPTATGKVTVATTEADVPVAVMVKDTGRFLYIFAICMRDRPTRATFNIKDIPGQMEVEVLDEQRVIIAPGASFTDRFQAYQLHIYKIARAKDLRPLRQCEDAVYDRPYLR